MNSPMQAAPRLSPPSWSTPPTPGNFFGLTSRVPASRHRLSECSPCGSGDPDRPSGKIIAWPHRAEDAPMFCGADVTKRCGLSPRKHRRALAPVHRPASREPHLSLSSRRSRCANRASYLRLPCSPTFRILPPPRRLAPPRIAGLPHPRRRQGSLRRPAQAPRRAAAIRLRPPRCSSTRQQAREPAYLSSRPACTDAPTPAVELLQLARLKFESRSDRQE